MVDKSSPRAARDSDLEVLGILALMRSHDRMFNGHRAARPGSFELTTRGWATGDHIPMNDMGDALRNVGPNDAEANELTDTWTTPWVVRALRRVSLFLLIAGLAEAIVWYGNVRLFGSSGGTVTNVFVATFGGALLVAVVMAVCAYVLDLLMYFNHCTRITLTAQTADA